MFYMVLNNALQPQSPAASGFLKAKSMDVDANNKLYFEDKALADEFAEWLAARNQGQRYYRAKVEDYVQTQEPPVVWKNKDKKDG